MDPGGHELRVRHCTQLRSFWRNIRLICVPADFASRSSRRPRWDVMSLSRNGGSHRRDHGADLRLAMEVTRPGQTEQQSKCDTGGGPPS